MRLSGASVSFRADVFGGSHASFYCGECGRRAYVYWRRGRRPRRDRGRRVRSDPAGRVLHHRQPQPDLAAGQSETYDFNQPNGGFLVGAGENGLDDSTTYQLILTLDGATLSSNVFSPTNNPTGTYVDFLATPALATAPAALSR
jgi:hypothetical protein